MMCKHDGLWIEALGNKKRYCSDGFNETSVRRSICGQCYRTKTEIDLEAQLAAAQNKLGICVEELAPEYFGECSQHEVFDCKMCWNGFIELKLTTANAEITKLRASYRNCEEEKGEKYEKSI